MAKGNNGGGKGGAKGNGGGKAGTPGPGQAHFPGWPAGHTAKGPSGGGRYNGSKNG